MIVSVVNHEESDAVDRMAAVAVGMSLWMVLVRRFQRRSNLYGLRLEKN